MGQVIGYANQIDSATLSGGSWNGSYPLGNIASRYLSLKARTTNALAASSVIDCDLGGSQPIGVVALVAHNLTSVATVRVQGAENSGHSPDIYDSGAVALSAGATHIQVFPQQLARYWRISISDTSNPAGYIAIGRVFIGARFSPAYGMSFGASFGVESRTEVSQALSGHEVFMRAPTRRVMSGKFEFMSNAERSKMIEIMSTHGISEEFVFVLDDADPGGALDMLCRMYELSEIEYPYVDLNNMGVRLVELL